MGPSIYPETSPSRYLFTLTIFCSATVKPEYFLLRKKKKEKNLKHETNQN